MTLALIGVAVAVLYWFPIRRWFASWGTRPVDRRRAMPGDVAVVDPTYLATLAITIDAAPESNGEGPALRLSEAPVDFRPRSPQYAGRRGGGATRGGDTRPRVPKPATRH